MDALPNWRVSASRLHPRAQHAALLLPRIPGGTCGAPCAFYVVAAKPCCPALAACRFVFHGVHMMLQFGSSAEGLGKPWQPGEKRVNRVVFIGELRGTG